MIHEHRDDGPSRRVRALRQFPADIYEKPVFAFFTQSDAQVHTAIDIVKAWNTLVTEQPLTVGEQYKLRLDVGKMPVDREWLDDVNAANNRILNLLEGTAHQRSDLDVLSARYSHDFGWELGETDGMNHNLLAMDLIYKLDRKFPELYSVTTALDRLVLKFKYK